MVEELVFSDTFSEWKDKINALVVDHLATAQELDDFVATSTAVSGGPFGYKPALSVGLSLAVNGGNVRNGSTVEFLADTTVTLPASSTRVLVIYKIAGEAPSLQLWATNAVPDKNIIPIGIFTTNTTAITAYTDLRTQFSMSSGSASAAGSILQFDSLIDVNITIPSTKNALSVNPTVANGITVTVSNGSTWVVL